MYAVRFRVCRTPGAGRGEGGGGLYAALLGETELSESSVWQGGDDIRAKQLKRLAEIKLEKVAKRVELRIGEEALVHGAAWGGCCVRGRQAGMRTAVCGWMNTTWCAPTCVMCITGSAQQAQQARRGVLLRVCVPHTRNATRSHHPHANCAEHHSGHMCE